MIGLNSKPKIISIEFTLLNTKGSIRKEYIALGINDLDEQEKEYLKNYGAHGTPFDITT